MAKSGQIQLDGGAFGASPLADSVVFTESTPQSLGGTVADLLDNSETGLKVVVDIVNRKVMAFPMATELDITNGGDPGLVTIGTITRDDATKKSSPVTLAPVTDIAGMDAPLAVKNFLSESFAASKPSKNVAAIVNAAEDALANLAKLDVPLELDSLFVVVDQTGDGSVQVLTNVTEVDDTDAVAKLKQELQATSTVAALAFE